MEKWENILNSDYQVSSTGYIRRIKKNGRYRYLKSDTIDRYGYPKITLRINGKVKYFSIHRLVAQAFISNPNNLPQVNHIDGCKTNNRVDNLEWVTASKNNLHKYKTMKTKCSKGVVSISNDWNTITFYSSIREASRVTGIDKTGIRLALNSWDGGTPRKTAKGYYWHYAEKGDSEL